MGVSCTIPNPPNSRIIKQIKFLSQRPYLVISRFLQYTTVGNPLYRTAGNPPAPGTRTWSWEAPARTQIRLFTDLGTILRSSRVLVEPFLHHSHCLIYQPACIKDHQPSCTGIIRDITRYGRWLKKSFFVIIRLLGGFGMVENTPTGCGDNLPILLRSHIFTKIEKCKLYVFGPISAPGIMYYYRWFYIIVILSYILIYYHILFYIILYYHILSYITSFYPYLVIFFKHLPERLQGQCGTQNKGKGRFWGGPGCVKAY